MFKPSVQSKFLIENKFRPWRGSIWVAIYTHLKKRTTLQDCLRLCKNNITFQKLGAIKGLCECV